MNGTVREFFKSIGRSKGWSKVRKQFLALMPACAVCGKTHFLQVHHIKDFSTNPELELDSNNLITLCSTHHLFFGHLGNWKSINPNVVEDCRSFRIKLETRRGNKQNKAHRYHIKIKTSRNNKYYFILRANNNEIIATSEMYETKRAAIDGAKIVKVAASLANIR
jgi:uncharacterized protein YegP (UPF0339 family)